jgi:hypothetical protein
LEVETGIAEMSDFLVVSSSHSDRKTRQIHDKTINHLTSTPVLLTFPSSIDSSNQISFPIWLLTLGSSLSFLLRQQLIESSNAVEHANCRPKARLRSTRDNHYFSNSLLIRFMMQFITGGLIMESCENARRRCGGGESRSA